MTIDDFSDDFSDDSYGALCKYNRGSSGDGREVIPMGHGVAILAPKEGDDDETARRK